MDHVLHSLICFTSTSSSGLNLLNPTLWEWSYSQPRPSITKLARFHSVSIFTAHSNIFTYYVLWNLHTSWLILVVKITERVMQLSLYQMTYTVGMLKIITIVIDSFFGPSNQLDFERFWHAKSLVPSRHVCSWYMLNLSKYHVS